MENLYKAIAHMFDDFTQPCAAGAAYPIPFLWAEEAHADAAVYEEWKRRYEVWAFFGFDELKTERGKVMKVLAKLAEENGWKRNRSDIEALDGVIFKINPAPDKVTAKPKPKPKPTSNKMEIDMEMLAKMMEGLMVLDFTKKPRTQVKDIQTRVLIEIAKENGWKEYFDPRKFRTWPPPKVYKIL